MVFIDQFLPFFVNIGSLVFWVAFVAVVFWVLFRKNKNTNTNVRTAGFVAKRMRSDVFVGLPLTLLGVVFVLLLAYLIALSSYLLQASVIAKVDLFIAAYFFEHRQPFLNQLFVWVTFGGEVIVVYIVSILLLAFLLLKKYYAHAFLFLLTLSGTGLMVYVTKLMVHRARPGLDFAYYIEKSLSFPSAHAAVALALYGYIAYFFLQYVSSRKRRKVIFSCALLFILAIGLSRMYLGVHFFSDVIGGYVVGALWLILGIVSNELIRYKKHAHPSTK